MRRRAVYPSDRKFAAAALADDRKSNASKTGFPNRNRKLRRFASLFGVLLSLLLAPACAWTGPGSNADDLLIQTVSGLSGTDHFTFEGTTQVSVSGLPLQEVASFEGTVTGHNRLSMTFRQDPGPDSIGAKRAPSAGQAVVFDRSRNEWIVTSAASESEANLLLLWNPLYKLEQLNKMSKRTESEQDASERRLTLLTVTPDPSDVTSAAKEQLMRQAGLLDPARKLAEMKQELGLSDQEASRMKGDLERSVQEAKRQLDEAVGSLSASAVYKIWVDRITRLPQKMQVVTDMRYTSAGQPKQETIRVDYRFSGFDK